MLVGAGLVPPHSGPVAVALATNRARKGCRQSPAFVLLCLLGVEALVVLAAVVWAREGFTAVVLAGVGLVLHLGESYELI